MYESSQYLVGLIVDLSLIAAAAGGAVALFTRDARPEVAITRLGNSRDQSRPAVLARRRIAAGHTADGSADYT